MCNAAHWEKTEDPTYDPDDELNPRREITQERDQVNLAGEHQMFGEVM